MYLVYLSFLFKPRTFYETSSGTERRSSVARCARLPVAVPRNLVWVIGPRQVSSVKCTQPWEGLVPQQNSQPMTSSTIHCVCDDSFSFAFEFNLINVFIFTVP